jgi:molybdate transport system substrate-binding protein
MNTIRRQNCGKKSTVGSLRFNFTNFCWSLFFSALAVPAAAGTTDAAPAVSIAAASNLIYALDELNAAFRQAAPEIHATVVTGASGTLVAQIKQGAPYDIFLSADMELPQALIAQGYAAKDSLTRFATGQLVLWTTRPTVELRSLAETVKSTSIHKLSIANMDSAPYGRAARQALERSGVWTDAKPKLVIGENITQTAQFVETGNADVGFVALSLVLSPKLKQRGHWILVPQRLYDPLDQGAVLTLRGAHNPAAVRFLAFLKTETARRVLERFGYIVPPSP